MSARARGDLFAPLGELDFELFLEERGGAVKFDLIDAGMIRPVSEQYEWVVDEAADTILLTPAARGRRPAREGVTIPRRIALTPHLIVFLAMYDGDGNKTNQIGYAGDHHLQEFVDVGLRLLFGDAFQTEVTLLEDSRYFEGPEAKAVMEEIAEYLVRRGQRRGDIGELELQRRALLKQAGRSYLGKMPERVRYVISSKKGARATGHSSFEIIHNFPRSGRFLPFLLAIVKETIGTILRNAASSGGARPSIRWGGPPHEYALQRIDLESYVRSKRCCYATGAGRITAYEVQATDGRSVWLRKPTGSTFAVHREVPITPLLCAMFGLYLAEGTTNKGDLFRFRKQNVPLSLGFNSSEDASLIIFLRGMAGILPELGEIVSEWLVKIGTKYFPETIAVGEKLGVPVTRGGTKGQGRARTVEVTDAVREWAVRQFPSMKVWEDLFTHIEFTGAGIPRVDVRCRSYPAPLLFALIVDLVFSPREIAPHLRS